jgi:hypothetical protein
MESTQAVADPKIEKRSVGGSVSTTVIEIDFDELCRSQIEIKKLEARKEIEELEVPIIKNTEKERKDYGLEREDLSPEIHLSDDYAQWTRRRPSEQI